MSVLRLSICMCVSYPFGFEGENSDLTVLFPDYYRFYFPHLRHHVKLFVRDQYALKQTSAHSESFRLLPYTVELQWLEHLWDHEN